MTTAAHTTPRALTAYLTRATWGLPEARRQELWDELEEHILTRTDHLILSGLTPTQATAQAIHELGPPARVTLGMAQVYTMPKLILAATTLALGISAGLYALAGGNEPRPLTFPLSLSPSMKPTCVRGTVPEGVRIVSTSTGVTCYTDPAVTTMEGAFLSLRSLQQAIAPAGGQLVTQADGATRVNLPGSSFLLPARFTRNGEQYFQAGAVAGQLIARHPDARISGFAQPTLEIGGRRITFGTAQQHIGETFYQDLALDLVSSVTRQPASADLLIERPTAGVRSFDHKIAVALAADELVLLVRRTASSRYTVDVQPVRADGNVTLHANWPSLHFVGSTDQLKSPDAAVLVRLSHTPLGALHTATLIPRSPVSFAR